MHKGSVDGLLVTTVVFMALSTTLGVTTYVGYKGMSEKKQLLAATKAQTQEQTTLNSSVTKSFNDLKTKLGYEAITDSAQLLETMSQAVDGSVGANDQFKSYRSAIQTLGASYSAKCEELESYKGQQRDASAEWAYQQSMTSSQQKIYARTLKGEDQELPEGANVEGESGDWQSEGVLATHADVLKSVTDTQNALEDAKKDQEDQNKSFIAALENEAREVNTQTANNKEALDAFLKTNVSLNTTVDTLLNSESVQPDAYVAYADQRLKTVRLSVGEKDGVKPLTTFNVYQNSALDMNTARSKGSVQVVRTLGEHSCEAKILEDQMSDPIRVGDLVYTPLWRPGKVIRFALDYNLDINGDGVSDLSTIMEIIQASGAEVAAYIDDNGEVQGAITEDVYRFVRSDKNIVDLIERDSTRDQKAREALQATEQRFVDAAEKMGVETIFLSDFLKSIGYAETAKITRYREAGSIDLIDDGVASQVVSPGTVSPVYTETPQPADPSSGTVAPRYRRDPEKAPLSPGIVAPVYKKDADVAPNDLGRVSDYYQRDRTKKTSKQ